MSNPCQTCDPYDKEDVEKAYRRGYRQGMKAGIELSERQTGEDSG